MTKELSSLVNVKNSWAKRSIKREAKLRVKISFIFIFDAKLRFALFSFASPSHFKAWNLSEASVVLKEPREIERFFSFLFDKIYIFYFEKTQNKNWK